MSRGGGTQRATDRELFSSFSRFFLFSHSYDIPTLPGSPTRSRTLAGGIISPPCKMQTRFEVSPGQDLFEGLIRGSSLGGGRTGEGRIGYVTRESQHCRLSGQVSSIVMRARNASSFVFPFRRTRWYWGRWTVCGGPRFCRRLVEEKGDAVGTIRMLRAVGREPRLVFYLVFIR